MTRVQRPWEAEAGKVDLGPVISGLVCHPNEMKFILVSPGEVSW